MRFRHKVIGAFLLLSVFFVGYFHFLAQSKILTRKIHQTSREIVALSNEKNLYYDLYTQQKKITVNDPAPEILYVHILDEEQVATSLEARVLGDVSEYRRSLTTLLFPR